MNDSRRNKFSITLAAFGLCWACVLCVGSLAAANFASPCEQLRALTQEYQKAQAEFSKLYQQAKTDAEREKLRSEKMPDGRKFAPRVWEIAVRHPKDAAAVDALVWLTTNAYQSEEAAKALGILAHDHAASDKAAAVCGIAPYISPTAAKEFLRAVLEKSPKRETQAQACLSLYTTSLMSDPSQAEPYLKRLEADFATLPSGRGQGTIGEFVKSEQEHNRTFGIGKTAPDAEGEDVDGKKFKLSDYRGKVVVIDFWGDW